MKRDDIGVVAWILLTVVVTYFVYGGMDNHTTLGLVIAVIVSAVIAGGIVGAALFGLDLERKVRD